MVNFTVVCVVLALAVVAAGVFAVWLAVKQKEYNDALPIDTDDLELSTTYVKQAFRAAAENIVKKKYAAKHKKITTNDGLYSADYLDDYNKIHNKLVYICCKGSRELTKNFKKYLRKHFKRAERADLPLIIERYCKAQKREEKKKKYAFLEKSKTLTPEEFFDLVETINGDYVGVYVLYNRTRNMYYVGKAMKMLEQIDKHFAGKGNGDVYADYKYGSEFRIKIIRLIDSGYSDLDNLERVTAEKYGVKAGVYRKGKKK